MHINTNHNQVTLQTSLLKEKNIPPSALFAVTVDLAYRLTEEKHKAGRWTSSRSISTYSTSSVSKIDLQPLHGPDDDHQGMSGVAVYHGSQLMALLF